MSAPARTGKSVSHPQASTSQHKQSAHDLLTAPFWGALLRYISSPILAIVFSFGYPQFYGLRNDPPYIFGFILAHIVILSVLLGFSLPRYLDVFIPPGRENDGVKNLGANVTEGLLEARQAEMMENSSGNGSDSEEVKGKN